MQRLYTQAEAAELLCVSPDVCKTGIPAAVRRLDGDR